MPKFRVIETPPNPSVYIPANINVVDIEAGNRAEAYNAYLAGHVYRHDLMLLDEAQVRKLVQRLSKFEPEETAAAPQPVKKDSNKAIDKQALESRLKDLKDNLAEIEENAIPTEIMAEQVEQMQNEIQEIEQKLKGL